MKYDHEQKKILKLHTKFINIKILTLNLKLYNITMLRCPPPLRWGFISEAGGSLNLPPPASIVEMLTNVIFSSNEEKILN